MATLGHLHDQRCRGDLLRVRLNDLFRRQHLVHSVEAFAVAQATVHTLVLIVGDL